MSLCQTVGQHEVFTLPSVETAHFPLDDSLSASECVNCRCIIVFVARSSRQSENYQNLVAKNEDITYTNLYNEAQEADWELEAGKHGTGGGTISSGTSNPIEAHQNVFKKPEIGDRHYREYQNMLKQTDSQLQRSAKSYAKRLNEHRDYVANPKVKVVDWDTRDPRYQNGMISNWNDEINNFEVKISWAEELLKERGLL